MLQRRLGGQACEEEDTGNRELALKSTSLITAQKRQKLLLFWNKVLFQRDISNLISSDASVHGWRFLERGNLLKDQDYDLRKKRNSTKPLFFFFYRRRQWKKKPATNSMASELEPLELKNENAKAAANVKEPPPYPQSPSSKTTEPVWRSRCCTPEGTVVTKSLLTFSLTSLISVIVLCFSLYMLTAPDLDESMKTLYISLVSSISSLHVPSPLQKL